MNKTLQAAIGLVGLSQVACSTIEGPNNIEQDLTPQEVIVQSDTNSQRINKIMGDAGVEIQSSEKEKIFGQIRSDIDVLNSAISLIAPNPGKDANLENILLSKAIALVEKLKDILKLKSSVDIKKAYNEVDPDDIFGQLSDVIESNDYNDSEPIDTNPALEVKNILFPTPSDNNTNKPVSKFQIQ